MELTPSQCQLRKNIMETYIELGLQQGFNRVLLDELASSLNISKKTIYKYFTNKEALISACIDHVFQTIDAGILPIASDNSLNIIDKITKLLAIVADQLSFFSIRQVHEIEELYPALWEHVKRERNIRLARYEALFEAAMKEGLIKDYDPKLLVQLLMVSIEHFTKEPFMKEHQLTYSQILTFITDIIFHGVLKNDDKE